MSRIVRSIFGGRSSSERILEKFRPVGFQAPGATGTFDQVSNTFSLSRTPERESAIAGVVSGFEGRAAAIRGLRPQVEPGFGRLSQVRREGLRTRLSALRSTGRRVVGNVREQLARRRLAGSSFQASEVARAEATFAREEDVVRAEAGEAEAQAFLQEIGLSTALIAEEFDATIQASQTILTELNFDTSVVTALAGQSSALLAENIRARAEARAAQEAAGEDFLGTILGLFSGKQIFT